MCVMISEQMAEAGRHGDGFGGDREAARGASYRDSQGYSSLYQ